MHHLEETMPQTRDPQQNLEISSMDRLIQAMLEACQTTGSSDTSVRSLAAAAGVPVSAIYHYFGNMEQLYVTAQEHALTLAGQWCCRQLGALDAVRALSPQGFAPLLATLIDDLCEWHRPFVFAWRDCQLLAGRAPRHGALVRRWTDLWTQFWTDICVRCGFPECGLLTTQFVDGESLLHLMRWQRAIDRPCLDETCRGWVRWLGGELADDSEWRALAFEQAGREMPPLTELTQTMQRIADAAADIVADRGASGLTHRAVAAEAGLTLGIVSHNCHTSADLVRIAFEMIYRRTVALGSQPSDEGDAGLALEATPATLNSPRAMLSAMDELLLAVARDPSLRSFVPQMRYWRGRTSGKMLQAMLGPDRLPSRLDAALFSGLASGMRKWCLGLDPAATDTHGQHVLDQLDRLLSRRGAPVAAL